MCYLDNINHVECVLADKKHTPYFVWFIFVVSLDIPLHAFTS